MRNMRMAEIAMRYGWTFPHIRGMTMRDFDLAYEPIALEKEVKRRGERHQKAPRRR